MPAPTSRTESEMSSGEIEQYEVVVIGAGINGLYQLHKAREAGFSAVALEAGLGVGGAWYWNRYPGARLDSEAYTYTYHFSKELIEEWDWDEEFATQGKLEEYFNYVADRFSLRGHIVFNTRVVAAEWDESRRVWQITTTDGRRYESRFLVAASGILTAPYIPPFAGVTDFRGELVHTARWPEEGIELDGKRVAVVGVGSTGIQVIQTIAPTVGHLTVFQRTANWAKPLNNKPISTERSRELKANADDYYAATMRSRGCFIHTHRYTSTWDVPDSERPAVYEELYAGPGMSMYQGGFADLLTDEAANAEISAFLASKIRERVADPATAEKLIPNHPFATKRPPLETGYFETYNRPNVDLVHLPDEPIVRFTADGVETSERFIPLDAVIIATGFDAITGSFMKLGLKGVDGVELTEWWSAGPRTYFGVLVHHFPNLFIIGGPQGVNGNQPRCTEFAVNWVTSLMEAMREHGDDRVEVEARPEAEWVAHCTSIVTGTLLEHADNWAWGSNIPGKTRAYTMYNGPQPDLRKEMTEVADAGYPGITFSGASSTALV